MMNRAGVNGPRFEMQAPLYFHLQEAAAISNYEVSWRVYKEDVIIARRLGPPFQTTVAGTEVDL